MRPVTISLMAAIASVIAGAGCSQLPLNPAYAGPKPRPAEFVARYHFEALPELTTTNRVLDETGDFRIREITVFMENKFADRLFVHFYEQQAEGKFPLIIMSSFLSDPNEAIGRLVARYYARHGYNCAVVMRGAKKLNMDVRLDDFEEWQRAMLRDYAAVKQVLSREPRVDAKRVATFGLSYGALNSTVVAGTDDGYQAHVIALAGGPLSEVLSRSHDPPLRIFLREYCRKHQCTRQDFIDHWAVVEADPLKVAPYVDASKVLLVLSRFDLIVPYDNGLKLRRAMGEPETLLLFAGHYTIVPYIGYLLPRSLEFFDHKLGVSRP